MSVGRAVFHLVLLAIWAVFPFVCVAQGSNAGAVAGVVLAPDGGPVAGATIALFAPDTQTRTLTSAGDGSFLFRDLPSGGYTIKTTASSFAQNEQTVSVAVGRTAHLSIRLAIASTQQNVNVTAAPVTFDTSQTSSVVNIDRDRVEELPIPSRNYLTFVLLSPQVAAANPALRQQGTTPSGGTFSFGGLRPGSNAIYLDGVNDNDEYTGSSRTQLSPEAISYFQIVNHEFSAQSGGGAGGSIDVQTRTGVNRIHGDAFTFVQNGALNGTPPLGLNPYKPDETRVRAGVALGGPIQRDRTFYYVAAEQEMARGEDTNDLNPSTLSTINRSIQQYAPLAGLTLQSGFFPTTDQETELSGRIDRSITARESIMLRYALTNSRNVNDAFHTDELTDRTARGSSFLTDNSLNGTLTSTMSASLLNKFSFELAQRRAVARTERTSGPGNRQFQDDLQIMAGYTYSKTIDDASYDSEQPQNPYAIGNERALSLMDQRHRFTLRGLWLIGPDLGDPADAVKNANPGPWMKALTGLEFAPIVSIASGFRANPITGLDSNRAHIFPFATRPAGHGRNSLQTPTNVDLDLRVLKMIPIGSGHLDVVAESFGLLNHQNVSLLNTTFGSELTSGIGFAQPIATSTGRRIQFSLDYEF